MENLRLTLPANRIAAVCAFLAALAAEIAAIAGAFEPGGAEAAVMVAALVAQLGTIAMFLLGSQKHEERQELGMPLLGGYDTYTPGDAEMGTTDEPSPAA